MRTLTTETAIVGGGLMGCWTAYFLRRRRRSVAVLEKGPVGAQASGVNFGNVRLQGRHSRQLPLAIRAHEQWEQIESLIGESCEFAATGHLYVAGDETQQTKLEQYAKDAQAHGIEVELLTPAEIRSRWPWLGGRPVGGCYSARDGAANPRLVTPAVARAARRLGAEILERTKVVSVEKRASGFRLTTDGDVTIESEFLINAAGAWALDIAKMFGETAPMFAAGPPQFVTEPLPYFIEPAVQLVDGSVIFRQVARGNVVVAGYPRGPSDPVANRAPVPPAKTLATMRRLAETVPPLAHAQVIRVWSGIEGYIPDMLPVIGPSATTEGLFHAFGFCGHGFQLGPGVGLVMSELIVDGETRTPLDAFSISRFIDPLAATTWAKREEFDESLTVSTGGRR
jgi:sarcosine oxidase subunit beta